jgi:hypothetical protein
MSDTPKVCASLQSFEKSLRQYVIEIKRYYELDSEWSVLAIDESDELVERLIDSANRGDDSAIRRLFGHLRFKLMKSDVPDPRVARWASYNLGLFLMEGVSLDVAFGLGEPGRPRKGQNNHVHLLSWEQIEYIRQTQGLSVVDACAVFEDQRAPLESRSASSYQKDFQHGKRIVEAYIKATGKKPPEFSSDT